MNVQETGVVYARDSAAQALREFEKRNLSFANFYIQCAIAEALIHLAERFDILSVGDQFCVYDDSR